MRLNDWCSIEPLQPQHQKKRRKTTGAGEMEDEAAL